MPAKPPIKTTLQKRSGFLSWISEETLFKITMCVIAVALIATAIATL